jgi:putative DeoR family transcriptional regulator (stage III sporulation protein D)
MNKDIKKRVLSEANHIIKTQDTIRKTADRFNVSKSTVHTDLSERLKEIDNKLSSEIDDIFKIHDREKHIRGGEVTRQKYKRG